MPLRGQGYIEPGTNAVISHNSPTSQQRAYASPGNQTGAPGLVSTTSSGVGASGTSTSPGTGSGMTPYTGWAGGRYAPGALNDSVYENPWYLIPDVYEGISLTSPGYQYLRDFGADPLSLYNIMAGSSGSIDGGAGDFANFMAELYQNLGTVGGSGFDTRGLLSNIFGADETSTLGQILSAGDQNTQVRTLFNLLRDVSNVGMNPLAARGYQAAVAREGDRYGNEMLSTNAGDTTGPLEWMSRNAPWLTVR